MKKLRKAIIISLILLCLYIYIYKGFEFRDTGVALLSIVQGRAPMEIGSPGWGILSPLTKVHTENDINYGSEDIVCASNRDDARDHWIKASGGEHIGEFDIVENEVYFSTRGGNNRERTLLFLDILNCNYFDPVDVSRIDMERENVLVGQFKGSINEDAFNKVADLMYRLGIAKYPYWGPMGTSDGEIVYSVIKEDDTKYFRTDTLVETSRSDIAQYVLLGKSRTYKYVFTLDKKNGEVFIRKSDSTN